MGRLNFLLHYYYVFMIASTVMISMEANTASADKDRKSYIVYLGSLQRKGKISTLSQHLSLLDEVLDGSSSSESLVTSYKRSFNGFAARLTEKEREKLANMEGVVSVFPNRIYKPQTTRSWDFLGFTEAHDQEGPTLPAAAPKSDVIIGHLDSGVWPESESFSDEGFGPPPKRWKGACAAGKDFICNNKLIGARYYNFFNEIGDPSMKDIQGHGTHTASIAGGNRVANVSLHGLANGTARGGFPSARIAAYKVCLLTGCSSADILAAFDDVIADGVDVITISLGFDQPIEFEEDPIAIGAFHAMAAGIITVHSAGNSGPDLYSTASLAPWLLSVAASTTDRKFFDRLVLGDGQVLMGHSINYQRMEGKTYPIVYDKEANLDTCPTEILRKLCVVGCLNETAVKGKIVLCGSTYGDQDAKTIGAAGAIIWSNGPASLARFPTAALSAQDLPIVESYYKSARKPTGKILTSETIVDDSAPAVANFSSRGPNQLIADIMKPDIAAPGVQILAAFSTAFPETDGKTVNFTIMSGTSMACPHVAGIAAYIKSIHPTWSPSAIRSALMTTARPMKVSTSLYGVLSFGSGQLNPVKASDPGLVYETSKGEYVQMLCDLGRDTQKLRVITGDNSSCPEGAKKGSPRDLNYPSLTAYVTQLRPFVVRFTRTVTNVGPANSTYESEVRARKHPRMKVQVDPPTVSFKRKGEKKSFVVTVTGKGMTMERPAEAATLLWSDGTRTVRSPITVYTDLMIIPHMIN